MNKRYFMIALLSCLILAGCGSAAKTEEAAEPVNASRFLRVESADYWTVYADRETGVMYVVSNGLYNKGVFTMLVDADGKPLLWEGEKDDRPD